MKDLKAFDKMLGKMQANVGSDQYIGEAGAFVQGAAKLKCSGFLFTNGELRGSIGLEVTESLTGKTAHVGTNKQYAIYVEMGTGPKGEANHTGTSPNIHPVYTQEPWWIHESQVDPRAAAVYNWFHIDTPNGRFYKVSGQPAHPYLYPAIHDNEKEIVDILNKGIEDAMEG